MCDPSLTTYSSRLFLNLIMARTTKMVEESNIESKRIYRLMARYALSNKTIVAAKVAPVLDTPNSREVQKVIGTIRTPKVALNSRMNR